MNIKEKKKKSEILLIVPPLPSALARVFLQTITAMSPLGIGYIAALLQKEGFQVDCLNQFLGLKKLKKLEHYIRSTKPKIVGFSIMTESYQNGILLAKFVKQTHPDTIIVFGGPHVTFMYEETLSNDCVDIVVRREGEYTMLELANYFVRGKGALNDIKGIAYKTNGKVVRTATRPMIKDLDKLPYPIRDIPNLGGSVDSNAYKLRNQIITSRGCPGRCKFCAAHALAGGKYRMRSIDNIAGELTNLKSKGCHFIYFADDTVSADVPRLLKLCRLTKELRVLWSAECRVDSMTKDLPIMMKNSGCMGLQFGVESGSQELLDQMGKDITLQQVKQAVQWATEAGVTVLCSMMIGLPEDTITTAKQTIDFAVRLQKEYKVAVLLGCTIPFPGTYYYNHAKELGIRPHTKNYNFYITIYPLMDTPRITRWQLRNLYFDAQTRLLQSMPRNYVKLFFDLSKASLEKEGYDILSGGVESTNEMKN